MSNVAMVVHSGDKSKEFWPYWLRYWQLHWSDQAYSAIYTIFLGETQSLHSPGIMSMCTGHTPWGLGLIQALNSLKFKYIIYQHEDYFLTGPPDVDTILNLVALMERENMVLMKCCGEWAGFIDTKNPMLKTEHTVNQEPIWLYNNASPYLISHQTSIWDKDFLLSTLDPTYTPWDHELDGSGRLRNRNISLHAYRGAQPIPYVETIIHGKVRPGAQKYFEGIQI